MPKSRTTIIGLLLLLPFTGCQTRSKFYTDARLTSVIATATGSTVIEVLSFNIAGDSKNWETRKSACYDVIDTRKPDIIGFQELLPVNLQWALDNFPELGWYGLTIE